MLDHFLSFSILAVAAISMLAESITPLRVRISIIANKSPSSSSKCSRLVLGLPGFKLSNNRVVDLVTGEETTLYWVEAM